MLIHLIVDTARKLTEYEKNEYVCITGNNIELVILLIAIPNINRGKLFIVTPSHGKTLNITYNISDLRIKLGDKAQHLLFYHAITGCDTTSNAVQMW